MTPYLVVPSEPTRKFEVRRPIEPRPVCFQSHPQGLGDWPCERPERLKGRSFVSPFDLTLMDSPFGEVGQELFIRVKTDTYRKNIPVRLVQITCDHALGRWPLWVLALEKI